MIKRRVYLFIPLLLSLVIASCAKPVTQTPSPVIILTQEQSPLVEPTALPPTPTFTLPAPTATSTPYVPLTATVIFDSMRLRVGPGYLFDTADLYPQNDKVKVLGKEPGEQWLYVQTSDELTGWMLIHGLQLDSGYLFEVPVITPENVMTIKGHVWASSHNPASQISVALIPGTSLDKPTEAVGTTNDKGEWYIYVPEDTRGEYSVVANGYGCKSNIATTNCGILGNFPPLQTITLPVNPDLWIEFQMEQ